MLELAVASTYLCPSWRAAKSLLAACELQSKLLKGGYRGLYRELLYRLGGYKEFGLYSSLHDNTPFAAKISGHGSEVAQSSEPSMPTGNQGVEPKKLLESILDCVHMLACTECMGLLVAKVP